MSYSALEQYYQRREAELLAQGELGRGAAALPEGWEKGRDRRIARAREDFFYYAKTYFPDEFFSAEWNQIHRRMTDDALRTDRKLAIWSAHRGFGKTAIFRALKCWCAHFGHKRYYGKVSDTVDLVYKDFYFVRLELRQNPRMVSDFGQVISDDWNNQRSFFIPPHKHNRTGTLFVAYSTTVTARGELSDAGRPDILEFDDMEDYSTSINPEISRSKLETIERDFLPALSDRGCAVLLGNNARTTCIINMLAEMSRADRAALHPAVELTIVPAWDEKHNRPTWHERYDYPTEEAMRIAEGANKSVWAAEYEQRPTPPEGIRFLSEHWRTYAKLPPDARGVIFCDPAFGETSDFKTGVVLLYSRTSKLFHVPEAFCRRCGWEQYFLWMFEAWKRWGSRSLYIGWESNFGQAQYLEFRKLYPSTKDRPDLPIRKIDAEGDKFFRIEQLETPFSLGHIAFPEDFLKTPDGVEAQSQLIGYIGKKTDRHRVDFPDALASAYKLVWPMAAAPAGGHQIRMGGRSEYQNFA